MLITTFESDKNPQGRRIELTWEDLCGWMSQPLPSSMPKSSLPMWSPATFVGDYRATRNTETVHAMAFDVDEAPVPTIAQMAAALRGVQCFVHSSSSATIAEPRWRLVVAISRPVNAAEHAHLWRVITGRLPFKVGAASKDCSRAWYMPRQGAQNV